MKVFLSSPGCSPPKNIVEVASVKKYFGKGSEEGEMEMLAVSRFDSRVSILTYQSTQIDMPTAATDEVRDLRVALAIRRRYGVQKKSPQTSNLSKSQFLEKNSSRLTWRSATQFFYI